MRTPPHVPSPTPGVPEATTGAPWRSAYLARLRVDAEPPSVEALFRLHRAHVERVPYETLWIHLGEQWDVGTAAAVERIARKGRGGYCFHLNGALAELLAALGYDVTRHVGGVHGPVGPAEGDLTNHLVLTVAGLPSDANPDGTWYVDAGLGDTLHEPLPLLTGTYRQGPFQLSLEETPDGIGDWHLTHDTNGSFTGMSWRSAATEIGAFVSRHEWLSTSPDSGFVRVLTLQRRDATGVDILRGQRLLRVGAGANEVLLTTAAELADGLTDVFGIDLSPVTPAARSALWDRVQKAHAAWEAAGRP